MERRLAAILAADVVGYSRLMAADENGIHTRLKALRKDFVEPKIAEHRGRVVKLTGDGMLVEFASVVDAVKCAAAIQTAVAERQAELPEDQRIAFRIGINIGDVIVEEGDIYGDGVNVAARLEQLAKPGEICVSRHVCDHVKSKVRFNFEPLGEHKVKNIPEPVVVYRLLTDPGSVVRTLGLTQVAKSKWRWPAVAAAVVLLLGVGGAIWMVHFRGSVSDQAAPSQANVWELTATPSIAVLPFDNLSADPEQDYFGKGLAEDLITELSKLRGLAVIARNSSFAFADKEVAAREIGKQLGVRYLLEGSIRRAGDRLRINAQLIDATTDRHVWAARWDRPMDNIFEVQDELTRKIVGTLDVQLSEGEQAEVWRRQTNDPVAYDLFLKGRALKLELNRDAATKAVDVLEEAVARDPEFAAAWVMLGWVYWAHVYMGIAEDLDAFEQKTIDAAQKAIDIDRRFGDPHALLSEVADYNGDPPLAIKEAERAVELSPGNADNLAFLAVHREGPEALDLIERAMRLNPIPPTWYHNALGQVLLRRGRLDEAMAAFEDCLAQAPDFISCHSYLTAAFLEAGRLDEARKAAREILRINPRYSITQDNFWVKTASDSAERRRRIDLLISAGLSE